MQNRGFRLRALGEIAIRCRDFDAMVCFYENTLGLERLQPGTAGDHHDAIRFYRLGESHGGHIAVLALFEERPGQEPDALAKMETDEARSRNALHHLALTLPWLEQEAAATWLKSRGHAVQTTSFTWAGWRGIFTQDPDGNVVELVAADPQWHID